MTADWKYDSDDNQDSNVTVKKSRSKTKSPTQGEPNETNIRSKTNAIPEPSTCIGVFGLSKKTDEKTLWNTFEIFGKIKSVSLIVDKFTKESLGFAFINYEDLNSSTNAIKETNGMTLDSKAIRVDFSITKKAYTPTPGSGYKGKISRRPRDNDKRKFKKKHLARSRSRSFEGKHSAMKYLSNRNSPVNGVTCSRVPLKYSDSRDSHLRYETRRNSPVPQFSRQYSPGRNNSRYHSPLRYTDRGYSPLRRDHRGYSPERNLNRELYFQSNENRRYSPVRGHSPHRNDYRKYSPPKAHLRDYSPVRNEYRNYFPDRSVKMEYSIRHGFREYSPKQDRRFSSTKLDPYTLRNGVQIYSPTKSNIRNFSPERKNIRVYSPINRQTSPVNPGYAPNSPGRHENFKDHSIMSEHQRFFY